MDPLPTSDAPSFPSVSSDRLAPPPYTFVVIDPPVSTAARPKHVEVARARKSLSTAASACINILMALWICLVYGFPSLILGVALIVVGTSFPLVYMAANGAFVMLAGNGILRRAHLGHYTTDAVAARIGVIGGILATLLDGLITLPLRDKNGELSWRIRLASSVSVSPFAGYIGCMILQKTHVDLHGIDALHAARAGILGGAILAPGIVLASPYMFEALMIIVSPVEGMAGLGCNWLCDRAGKCWEDRGTCVLTLYCYICGRHGHDSDVEEQVQPPPYHN